MMQACADEGDHTSFVALLRSMSPNAIDQELRSMQVPACLPACQCMRLEYSAPHGCSLSVDVASCEPELLQIQASSSVLHRLEATYMHTPRLHLYCGT